MFDDEVICLNPRIKEETACPVGRPRKYDSSIRANELINGIMKRTVNSTLSQQNQKPHEKD